MSCFYFWARISYSEVLKCFIPFVEPVLLFHRQRQLKFLPVFWSFDSHLFPEKYVGAWFRCFQITFGEAKPFQYLSDDYGSLCSRNFHKNFWCATDLSYLRLPFTPRQPFLFYNALFNFPKIELVWDEFFLDILNWTQFHFVLPAVSYTPPIDFWLTIRDCFDFWTISFS